MADVVLASLQGSMSEERVGEAVVHPLGGSLRALGHVDETAKGPAGGRPPEARYRDGQLSSSADSGYTSTSGPKSEQSGTGPHLGSQQVDARAPGAVAEARRTAASANAGASAGADRSAGSHSYIGAIAVAELERLRADVQQLQVRLAASEAECRALQHVNRTQLDDLQRARGSSVALRGMLQEEVLQREDFAAECRRLQRELDLASSGINQSQRALRNAAEVVAKLEDEVEQLRASRSHLQSELQNANARVARLQNESRQHAERNSQLGTQLHGVVTTLRQLEGEHARLADGYSALQVELQLRAAETRAARAEAAELATDRARLLAQMQAMRAELERTRERQSFGSVSMPDASSEISMLRAELAANDSVLAEAEAALMALINEKNELQQQLSSAQAAEQLAVEEAESLRARLAALQERTEPASPSSPPSGAALLDALAFADLSEAASDVTRDGLREAPVTSSVSVAFGSPDLDPMGIAAAATCVSPTAASGRQRYPISPCTSGSSASPQSTFQIEAWAGKSTPSPCEKGGADNGAVSGADDAAAAVGSSGALRDHGARTDDAQCLSAAVASGAKLRGTSAVGSSSSVTTTSGSSGAAEAAERCVRALKEYRRTARSATGDGSKLDAQMGTPGQRAAIAAGHRAATFSGDVEPSQHAAHGADRPSTAAKLLLAGAASILNSTALGTGTLSSPVMRRSSRPAQAGSHSRESLERLLSEVANRSASQPSVSGHVPSASASQGAGDGATGSSADEPPSSADAAEETATQDSDKAAAAPPVLRAELIAQQPTLPYPAPSQASTADLQGELPRDGSTTSSIARFFGGAATPPSHRSSTEEESSVPTTPAHELPAAAGGLMASARPLPAAERTSGTEPQGAASRASIPIVSRVMLVPGASGSAPGPAAGADVGTRPGGGGAGGGTGSVMISPRMTLESMVLGRAVRQVTGPPPGPILRSSSLRSSSAGSSEPPPTPSGPAAAAPGEAPLARGASPALSLTHLPRESEAAPLYKGLALSGDPVASPGPQGLEPGEEQAVAFGEEQQMSASHQAAPASLVSVPGPQHAPQLPPQHQRPPRPPLLSDIFGPEDGVDSPDAIRAAAAGVDSELLPDDDEASSPQPSPTSRPAHVRLPSPAVSEASLSLSQLASRISGETSVHASAAGALGSHSEASNSPGSALLPRPIRPPQLPLQHPSAAAPVAAAAASEGPVALRAQAEESAGAGHQECSSHASSCEAERRQSASTTTVESPMATGLAVVNLLEEHGGLANHGAGPATPSGDAQPPPSAYPAAQQDAAAALDRPFVPASVAAAASALDEEDGLEVRSPGSASSGNSAMMRPSLASYLQVQQTPAESLGLPSAAPAEPAAASDEQDGVLRAQEAGSSALPPQPSLVSMLSEQSLLTGALGRTDAAALTGANAAQVHGEVEVPGNVPSARPSLTFRPPVHPATVSMLGNNAAGVRPLTTTTSDAGGPWGHDFGSGGLGSASPLRSDQPFPSAPEWSLAAAPGVSPGAVGPAAGHQRRAASMADTAWPQRAACPEAQVSVNFTQERNRAASRYSGSAQGTMWDDGNAGAAADGAEDAEDVSALARRLQAMDDALRAIGAM